MLSYNHIYHAGNHADVFKHITLSFFIFHLNQRIKPYTIIESHAGSGKYNLHDERALKTNEMKTGIKKILNSPSLHTDITNENFFRGFFLYFDFAKSCIKNDFYPGSPLIEKHFMRKCDNLILCELNKNECTLLKENVTGELQNENLEQGTHPNVNSQGNSKSSELQNVPSIHIHNIDGFLAFTSLTPPKIKRGLFFCDPSYEEKDEYKKVAHSFEKLFSKWNTCIFALWYPLLFHKENECTLMKQKIIRKAKATSPNISVLDAALLINKKDSHKEMPLQELKQNKNNPPRLYGSGMLIVNSPWQMDEKLKAVLPTLKNILQVSENGSFEITLY